jgi:hypothetical protein
MKKATSIILSALIGITFLFSAYSKLFPIEPFEYILVGTTFINWKASVIVARLIIGIEFILGCLFLFSLINKRILLIAAIILGVFSFHLLFQIIIKGNGSDCGCFGTWLSMTPLQAIIKNAIMLLVIYGLYRLNFSFNLKIKHKEFYISILAITSIFIVNPVDFGYSESYLNKPFSNFRLELDTVYNSKNLEKVEPPKMDLRKGKHIVGFLSSTCGHCKIAAQKLSVIHSENPSIPIYFFINGDNDKIKSFIAKTNTDKIPYSKLNSQLFIELAGLKLPVIYYLNNSVVEKQVDYFTLEQGHIEQWLKK